MNGITLQIFILVWRTIIPENSSLKIYDEKCIIIMHLKYTEQQSLILSNISDKFYAIENDD